MMKPVNRDKMHKKTIQRDVLKTTTGEIETEFRKCSVSVRKVERWKQWNGKKKEQENKQKTKGKTSDLSPKIAMMTLNVSDLRHLWIKKEICGADWKIWSSSIWQYGSHFQYKKVGVLAVKLMKKVYNQTWSNESRSDCINTRQSGFQGKENYQKQSSTIW